MSVTPPESSYNFNHTRTHIQYHHRSTEVTDRSDVLIEMVSPTTSLLSTKHSFTGSFSSGDELEDLPHPIEKPPSMELPSKSTPKLTQPPTKLRVKSAIQVALTNQAKGQSMGLMRWFTKSSPEDYQAHTKKVNAMISESLEDYESTQRMEVEYDKQEQRKKNRARQQKHRERVYAMEIAHGIRSPGGTKRRRLHLSSSLEDVSGKSESSIAELLRPYRVFKEKQHLKKKHPQGRKRIHGPRPATYHNWHTPFLWSQITNAARHPSVGWQMSSSRIVSLLKQHDPITFAGLSRTTVEGWIDRNEGKPKWSARALQKASDGNDPGLGNKGGRRGIFVRHQLIYLKIVSLNLITDIFPCC